MKTPRCFILIGCLIALVFPLLAVHEQELVSSIESVVVYPDSALIKRAGVVKLKTGENLVHINFLPTRLDPNSLKPKILGDQVKILDFSIISEQMDRAKYPQWKSLQGELESLVLKYEAISEQLKLQEEKILFARQILDSFTKGYGQKEGDLPSRDQVVSTWGLYEAAYNEGNVAIQSLRDELKPLQESIDRKNEELEELEQNLNLLGRGVLINLTSLSDTEIPLSLDYLVRSCSWQPVYEVRAYPLKKTMSFGYQAAISQQTGEDWKNVILSLSTSRASSMGTVPELYPIRLNKIEPRPVMRAMKMDTKMMLSAPPPVEEDGYELSAFAASEISSTYSSFNVLLPDRFSIQSGESQKKATLITCDLNAEYWTEVVSRLDQQAYLIGKVANEMDFPILSGSSILFVEDEIVGKSYIEETPVLGDVELSLGVNESIRVERKPGKINEAEKGVFGKNTRLTRQYFTTIENMGKHDVLIKFRDQAPLSENEKIDVVLESPESEQLIYEDPNSGIFTMETFLSAGKSVKVETKFIVTYPEGWEIPKI